VKHTVARIAIAFLLLLPAAATTAHAQATGKVYRIGYILTVAPSEAEHLTSALDEGLRELGYVEGRNVVFERRWAEGRQERLPALAAELVRLNVDVIVTGSNPVIAAVKQATTTIPVVMAASRDPVGAGFIASIGRPGGNITGLTNDPAPAILGKNLELLKEVVPGALRVALLWNPVPPGAESYKREVESAARKLAVTLRVLEVRGSDEIEGAFATMARERVDALVVLPDPITFTARSQVVLLAARHRLPVVYWQREYVDAGGLMSYGSDLAHQFRRAAVYVDKVRSPAIFRWNKPQRSNSSST
jgi:putative ABC transport system substrate-binding protein